MNKTGLCALALCALTITVHPSPRAQPPRTASQELVIGDQFDLRHIDPAQGMLDDTQILVYNGLVEMDSQFKQAPALAESWAMSDDGLVWTFNLRKNVTFHDGTPWNAQAALVNFKRLEGYPGLSDADRVETPDPYTLVFYMKRPTYTLSSNLARTVMSMVSPSVIQSDGSITRPVGSGPYKLVKWERDREFVFEAFDEFWGGPPRVKKITFKVITDPQARASALEAGEIDMMSGYQSLPAIRRLAGDSRFQLIKTTQNTSGALFYNLRRPPLDSKALRQAIGHGLPMNAMITNLLPGLASPASGFFSPAYGDLVNPQVKNPAYDPDRAKALLEESGWTSGQGGIRVRGAQPLRLTLTYGAANSEDALLAQAMRDSLRAIGIDLTLNPVEAAALDDIEETKNYDMILTGQSFIPTDDPAFHYRQGYWHSESYYKVYTSDPLDRLINELEITMDREKRRELHWAIQREIMDNAPMIVAYHRNSVRLAKRNIRNFAISSGCWHINRALKDAIIE